MSTCYVPVYGLDSAGKSRLCKAITSFSSQNNKGSSDNQLSVSTSVELLKPNNNKNQQNLPFIQIDPISTSQLSKHPHLNNTQKEQDDEKWKTENVFTPTYHEKISRQQELRMKPSATPVSKQQEENETVVNVFLPNQIAASPKNENNVSGSSTTTSDAKIAGQTTQQYFSPREAVTTATTATTNTSSQQQQQNRIQQSADSNYITASSQLVARGSMSGRSDNNNTEDDRHSVNPLLSSPTHRFENEDDEGKNNSSDQRQTPITLLDFSGSALLRGAWACDAALDFIFSDNQQQNHQKSLKLLWCVDASVMDRFRVLFSWSECLQLVKRLYVQQGDGGRIQCCVVLFDNTTSKKNSEEDDESMNKKKSRLLTRSFFIRHVLPTLTINGIEDLEEVQFEIVEASERNVKDVVKFLLK